MNQFGYIVKGFLLVFLIFIGAMMVMGVANAESEKQESGVVIDSYLPSNHQPPSNIGNSAGKLLFQRNCAMCHSLLKDDQVLPLAYALGQEQWSDRSKLYEWIRNPSAFMRKDKYTRELKDKFGSMMRASPDLTNDEIDAIVEYIREASNRIYVCY